MSVTDGRIRTTYGNIQIPKTQVKRAYERLRKRSYRTLRRSIAAVDEWLEELDVEPYTLEVDGPDGPIYTEMEHEAYLAGLHDMAKAVTDSNRDGI